MYPPKLIKVEILKYSNNKQDTKTNNFTKRQKWSNLVRGNMQNISQYKTNNNNTDNIYSQDELKPSFNSACDVPGSSMILQLDPSIPLYNYNNQRSYATINDKINDNNIYTLYNSIVSNDVIMKADTITGLQTRTVPLGVIKITPQLSNDIITITISSPIALYVNFTTNQLLSSTNNVNIKINTIRIVTRYNDTLISNHLILSDHLNNVSFDGSTISNVGQQYGIQYIGTITTSDIKVYGSSSNIIYDIDMIINYTCSYDTSNFTFFQTSIYSNISIDQISTTTSGFLFTSIPSPYVPGNFITL